MSTAGPNAAQAKIEAKQLRAEREARGELISHSRSLELVAQRHGYRDWNTFSAAICDRAPAGWSVGAAVRGRFRGQPITARLLAIERVRPGWYRVSLKLDEPVDVVSFESFSNMRQRITAVLGPAGASREKTSDGQPHLVLQL